MFPLRDRTRRRICRSIFVAIGVLPSLVLIAWCMAMTSPSHVASIRGQFAAAVGVDLRFEKLSYPRPGATLLAGLQLADPETAEPLAHVGQLELRSDEGHSMWIISEAEINVAKNNWLWRLIRQRLQLGAVVTDSPDRIAISDLTVRWPGGSQTFDEGNIQFSGAEHSRNVTAVLRPVSSAAAPPIQVYAERALDAAGPPQTTVQIDATQNPMQCSLWSALVGIENHCGPQSTWQGKLQFVESAGGWHCELSGQLKNVDLHAAVSEQFAQQLNGRADVDLRRLALQNGRLEACDATVRARDGSIGEQMIRMLGYLNLQTFPSQPPLDRLITFSEMNFDLLLDGTGLALIGRCGKPESGIVLRNQTGPLAATPNSARVNGGSLIKALVPQEKQLLVPATKQAAWLLNVLPMGK